MRIETHPAAPIAHGTVLFQDGAGNLHVTVIVKATYALRHGALAEPASPLPLGDEAASDLAPCKRLADVVVVSRVPPGSGRRVVGFAVARGPDVLVQKRLVAAGDGESLVDPGAPGRPAGLGPIAPTAPARLAFLPRAHGDALRADPPLLPDDLDLRFFQCAPADQQVARLLGGEQMLLLGLHPAHPVMRCRLPAQHAYARLDGPGASGRDVPLVGDTLWIDAERGLAAVTFRGSVEVATRAEAPALLAGARAWTVRAGMAPCANVEEVAGAPRSWSSPASARRAGDEALAERPRSASPTVDPIALRSEPGWAAGCFAWSFEPGKPRRVVVVKATFTLSPDGGAPAPSPEQDRLRPDEPASDGERAELLHASDFAPFKAQTDVLLRGTAHAAAGRSTALVQLELGAVSARVAALGPRSWDASGIPGPAGPFVPVPLRYEHAFGGPGFPANPAGTGFVAGTPPPRLEDPDRLIRSRESRPAPAWFGPIAPSWAARSALLGAYDRPWREERWPHFPADFDPAFFQAAPPRLRGDDLRGDEPFRIEGVRPDGQSFSGALPGVRARVFAAPRHGDPFEVVLRLDTVLFDTDAGRVFLTWRGSFEAPRDAGAIERVVVLREDLDSPRSADDVAAYLIALAEPRLAPQEGAVAPPGGSEARSFRFGDHRRELRAGAALAGVFAARAARAAPPPPRPPPPPSRDEVERLVAGGKGLRGRDLSGADLRGIDLSRQDLTGAILARAKLAGARFEAAILDGANLADVEAPDTIWNDADLSRADLTRADLSRASLVRARLDRAALAAATLVDARLDDAKAEGASLAGANLSGCRAEGAHLEKVDLSGAELAGASLRRARLDDAKLYEASGAGARLDEASLVDARFERATFPEASLRGAAATGAVWECADLSRAVLRGADLTGAIFSGARLAGADLVGVAASSATFREADLSGAALDGADLMQASFEGACLDGATLVGASLYRAETMDASLEGADLSQALLAGTKLER